MVKILDLNCVKNVWQKVGYMFSLINHYVLCINLYVVLFQYLWKTTLKYKNNVYSLTSKILGSYVRVFNVF